jgi:hypothetical protein
MITPKLTALMVAMSLMGAGGPIAAMAQATVDQDPVQAIGIETGRNTQANVAEVNQEAENEVEISSEAESGDAESEAEAEAEGKKSKAEAESGDAESEAEAETSVDDSVIVAASNQESNVNQANVLEDNDDVAVTATQVPIQVGVATDVDAGNDAAVIADLGGLLELLGLGA